MKRIFLAFVFLAAGGCATCQQHPVWCAVGSAVIVGSLAASVEHRHDQHVVNDRQIAPSVGPQCRVQPCTP